MLSHLIVSIVSVTVFAMIGATSAVASPTERMLFDFTNMRSGLAPQSGVVFGPDGALYGTTLEGGSSTLGGGGSGEVFRLAPPAPSHTGWRQEVLHTFTDRPSDGKNPYGNLVVDSTGTLYGTTAVGGASGFGAIFRLSSSGPISDNNCWNYSLIFSFLGGSGTYPKGPLLIDSAGNLYGTTSSGGAFDGGVVFKMTPPAPGQTGWTQTVLHIVSPDQDGYPINPALAMDRSGAIFGTIQQGRRGSNRSEHGSVFKLTPPMGLDTGWKYSVLYNFTNESTGSIPKSGVVIGADGVLYGTTSSGAAGHGAVYALTPPGSSKDRWVATVVHNLPRGPNAQASDGTLTIDRSGSLFGTSGGIVFGLSRSANRQSAWTMVVLHQFGSRYEGSPQSALTLDRFGALYGTTSDGGTRGDGTVFTITP
jgi:uncharacterized repeat protein (TIGR03803 family)